MPMRAQLATIVTQQFDVDQLQYVYRNGHVTLSKIIAPEREVAIAVVVVAAPEGAKAEKRFLAVLNCGHHMGDKCTCTNPTYHCSLFEPAELGITNKDEKLKV